MTAQEVFRDMVRVQIAPRLRALGFKGSGQKYHLPSETHWALLEFQKSAYSTAEEIRFAVNYGVVSKREWEVWRGRYPGAPARPSPNGTIGDPPLAPGQVQHWWRLDVSEPTQPLATDVLLRIEREALPEMRASMADTLG